jgi:hypothetical protein
MLDLKRRGRDVRAFVQPGGVGDPPRWPASVEGERRDGPGRGLGRPHRKARLGSGRCARTRSPPSASVRRWVSFHGLSINVEPDLSHFTGIVPCGIAEHGVTSLVDLGMPVTMLCGGPGRRCCGCGLAWHLRMRHPPRGSFSRDRRPRRMRLLILFDAALSTQIEADQTEHQRQQDDHRPDRGFMRLVEAAHMRDPGGQLRHKREHKERQQQFRDSEGPGLRPASRGRSNSPRRATQQKRQTPAR